ncbi:MAG: PH domain-containing protein [Candidatus Heimdallarchaeota archaeon]
MTDNKKEIFGVGNQKIVEEFLPDRKYIPKAIITWTLLWIAAVAIIIAISIAIILDAKDVTRTLILFSSITSGVMVTIYIIGVIFIFPYYNSLSYALTTQEIIVNRGFFIKRTKIVPYRNVTNFVMRRGIIDRIVGGDNFGTINIETAGQSGDKSHPEQRLEGIMDVSGYAEKLRVILSKMKGQAGVSADSETASSLDEEQLLLSILETLKEIKNKL